MRSAFAIASTSFCGTLYWWCRPTVSASIVTACTWQPKQLWPSVQASAACARYSRPRCAEARRGAAEVDAHVVIAGGDGDADEAALVERERAVGTDREARAVDEGAPARIEVRVEFDGRGGGGAHVDAVVAGRAGAIGEGG